MGLNRRMFLAGGTAAATLAVAPRVFAQCRLFMPASTSLYSLYVNTQGVAGG